MRRSDVAPVLAAAALAALALAGCTSSTGTAPPSLSSVEPSFAYAGAETPVVIRGSGFAVKAIVDAGSGACVEAGYRAWMGGLELSDVRWIDAGTLSARVPASLAPGRHDLVVAGPFGRGFLANAIEILEAAVLGARPTAPAEVSVGQEFDVALDVDNATASPVSGAVADVETSPGIMRISGPNGAQDVPPGGSARWQWRFRAASPGEVALAFSVRGTDPRTGATVSATASAALAVKRPAALGVASLVASPDPVNLAQDVFVEMVVSNSGGADALAVAPSLVPVPLEGVWLEGPTPASAPILAGGAVAFGWRWLATARGPLRFTGTAAGMDALSAVTVSAPARDSAAIVVQRPAALAADVVAPSRVNLGQLFDVALAVTNLGDAAAAGLDAELAVSPAGLVAASVAPAPVDLAGSASTVLKRRFAAVGVGDGMVHASATATDATDGRALALARSKGIAFELAADLAAQLELVPSGPIPPGRFEVRMTVTNRGDAVALGVSPADPSVLPGSSASASLVSGPVRLFGDGDLSHGETVTFSWTFATLSNGTLGMGASATALDANDGNVRSATAPGVWTEVTQDVRMLFSDPFGDGTAFTFLFAHGGRLHLGPDRTGAGAVRSNPDGSAAESVAFGFSRDVVDTDDEKLDTKKVHSNPAPPYLSLGYTGCTCNPLAIPPVCDCGPDVENARGLFTSGTAAGKAWLVAAGARTDGGLKYVYLTADDGPALQFSYVDLRALLSGESTTLTAATVFADRVYLGFSESSGSGPLLVALLTLPPTPSTPAQPGIEAIKDVDFLKMGLGSTILGKPPTKISWVDAMAGFAGRLYVVNDTGCIVSRTGTPASGDFDDCTPSAAAWIAKRSGSPPAGKLVDIEPADRAVPQLASWSGRLYAIRNTVDVATGAPGPQLWSCNPAPGSTPTSCEPGDWTLVAPNPSGDALLTQLGSARNERATLLAASATALYVGYDNADGVQLFRTSEPVPTSMAHFRGRDGCVAGAAGCQGLGGNGLGVGARRILDGKALTFGGVDRVYLVAGDGIGPVRVFRIPEGAP